MSTPTSTSTPPSNSALPTTTGRVLTQSDGYIELTLPGSEYRLYLLTPELRSARIGQRVTGTIHARAKRVDVVGTGGRFVEPIFGRPRRLQGRIIGGDVDGNRLFIACGPTVICQLADPRQKASDFAVGQLVAFEIEAGARFESI